MHHIRVAPPPIRMSYYVLLMCTCMCWWRHNSDPDHPDYHQPTDTYDRLNIGYFLRVCHLAVDIATEIDASLHDIAKLCPAPELLPPPTTDDDTSLACCFDPPT
jgi:hypothetical protein